MECSPPGSIEECEVDGDDVNSEAIGAAEDEDTTIDAAI